VKRRLTVSVTLPLPGSTGKENVIVLVSDAVPGCVAVPVIEPLTADPGRASM
jgi:hypothetical protein